MTMSRKNMRASHTITTTTCLFVVIIVVCASYSIAQSATTDTTTIRATTDELAAASTDNDDKASTSSSLSSSSSSFLHAEFHPKDRLVIEIGATGNLTISIQIHQQLLNVTCVIELSTNEIVDVTGISQEPFSISIPNTTIELEIKAIKIGRASLRITLVAWPVGPIENFFYEIAVLPEPINFGQFTLIGTFIGMALNLLGFACVVSVEDVKVYLHKRMSLLLGIVGQFVVMPGAAFILGSVMNLSISNRFALLAVASSPSGAPSNIVSLLLRGDVKLNVVMTFISCILSLIFMPFWVFTVGNEILQNYETEDKFRTPWAIFAILIASFTVPTILGIFICYLHVRVARILSLIVRPIALILVVVFFCFIMYDYYWVLREGQEDWKIIFASVILPLAAMFISFCAAILARQEARLAVTIAIQTAFTNPGLAMLFIGIAVPQPDGVLSYVVVGCYLFTIVVAAVVGWVSLLLLDLVKRWRKKRYPESDDEPAMDGWHEFKVVPPQTEKENEKSKKASRKSSTTAAAVVANGDRKESKTSGKRKESIERNGSRKSMNIYEIKL